MRRTVLVGAVAVLLLVGLGAAFVSGAFTSAGTTADGADGSSFPTATATPSDSVGASASTSTATASEQAFAFEVRRIESCGQTCRDVTSAVSNDGTEAATNVTVYSRVFVGNSTDPDDVAWRGSEQVGTLDAGETYAATETVKLSYSEAMAVKSAGGWVTVQTTVQSEEKTVTFTRRRKVA